MGRRVVALRDGDLDAIVVGRVFEGVPWLRRAGRMLETCDVRFGLELLCYTPEEFRRKRRELGIVRSAADEGVDLLPA